MTVRVVLADDQPGVRTAVRALLELDDQLVVVGEAGNGDQAVDRAAALRPDVVLMDVRMPGTNGLEATRRIVGTMSELGIRIIVLTSFDLDAYVFEALRSGASGFLLKNAPPDELRRAVRVVAAGQAMLDPAVTRRVIAQFAPVRADRLITPGGPAALTPREHDIVRHVAAGLSNEQISRTLVISVWTVKSHIASILRKLQVRDRTQIVIAAYEAGLVLPPSQDHAP